MADQPDPGKAQAERRAQLIERYGRPQQIPVHRAMRLGRVKDSSVTESNVYGARVATREAAEAWSAENLSTYGHPCLGIFEDKPAGEEPGWVYVLDLRPALIRLLENERRLEEDRPEAGE